MSETEGKKSTIIELFDFIETRLEELDNDLKEFQEKDKEECCLEYALYQRELEEVQLRKRSKRSRGRGRSFMG